MKKICHLLSAFHRYDTRTNKECQSLIKNDYDAIIIVNDNEKESINSGVRIIPTGYRYKGRLMRFLLAKKFIYKVALEVDADIYQIHDPELIPLGLKLKKYGKKVIFDSHEDFPQQIMEKEYIPKPFRKLLSWISEEYYRYALPKYDAILSVTPHIVQRLSYHSKKVHLITNFPILSQIDLVISKEDYFNRENYLSYVGTVYNTSSQLRVIKAINDINDVKYVIAGPIDNDYLKEIKLIIDFNKIEYIGHIPSSEVDKLYKKSTIGIALYEYTPNVGYNIGTLGVNKIFEYMYNGLPIICTDFILWKEIIDKYKCGICINPYDIKAIQNAIEYLVKNKYEAYQMGQNGRRAVLEEYNWDTQEKKYLEIIKSLL